MFIAAEIACDMFGLQAPILSLPSANWHKDYAECWEKHTLFPVPAGGSWGRRGAEITGVALMQGIVHRQAEGELRDWAA